MSTEAQCLMYGCGEWMVGWNWKDYCFGVISIISDQSLSVWSLWLQVKLGGQSATVDMVFVGQGLLATCTGESAVR